MYYYVDVLIICQELYHNQRQRHSHNHLLKHIKSAAAKHEMAKWHLTMWDTVNPYNYSELTISYIWALGQLECYFVIFSISIVGGVMSCSYGVSCRGRYIVGAPWPVIDFFTRPSDNHTSELISYSSLWRRTNTRNVSFLNLSRW